MELRQLSFRKSEMLRRSISRRVLFAALASVLLALPAAAGIVTMVLRGGNVVQKTAVGMQNIEEKRPMREDSIFQIMSMTKPML